MEAESPGESCVAEGEGQIWGEARFERNENELEARAKGE